MSLDHALGGVLRGQLSRSDTDTVICAAISYARSYLRWLMWHKSYSFAPLGMSVDDLAFDTIAELLSDIDGENMTRLRVALEEVMATQPVDTPCEYSFKAIVLRTVRLNIARVFTEMHPVRARLLRSLRRHAQFSNEIARRDSITGYWYSFTESDPQLKLPFAPIDVLRSLCVAPQTQIKPAPKVLTALLHALSEFPQLRQAVTEDDVLDITMSLLQTDQRAATPQFQEADVNPDTGSLATEALAALASLHVWMFSSYVSSGKLTEDEASAMLIAAERYINDLADGEEQGHYSYLRQLIPDLTHAEYRKRYRNIYEYVLRTVFTTTRERLQLNNKGSQDSAERR